MNTLRLCALAMSASIPAVASGHQGPLEIHVDCQGWGRTKACPEFLRSFIDDTPVLSHTSLADADVVLHVAEIQVALDDELQLRFVSRLEEGLDAFELSVRIDTRQTVDAQREALEPAFLGGVTPFLAQTRPGVVRVELAEDAAPVEDAEPGSPWSFSISGNGWLNWSDAAVNASVWGSLSLSYLTERARWGAHGSADWGLSRQPPLVVDGEEISLDSDTWGARGSVYGAYNVAPFWSVGLVMGGAGNDPEGRYEATLGAEAGVSRDFFKANDARGNSLSITALLGVQCDWYNRTNLLGQDRTCFPTARVGASGSITWDRVELWAWLSASMELTNPARRYQVSLSPGVSFRVGDHVDLNVGFDLTKQAIPGPANVDETSFEEVTRATYATPLEIGGRAGFRIHFDRTNGARNDRFESGWAPRF